MQRSMLAAMSQFPAEPSHSSAHRELGPGSLLRPLQLLPSDHNLEMNLNNSGLERPRRLRYSQHDPCNKGSQKPAARQSKPSHQRLSRILDQAEKPLKRHESQLRPSLWAQACHTA
ncbi:uncharacterized protein HMPREF1120_05527 [Exophiala dermatitidis NIH/UT8656]|uniref:Uncharacterized protein n=1 Tax=Exophiala dermatitidis (strain ATCC 34100 / CBS 525.76 / NIH/UT8656) TaxID=858893 RepID=H6BY58_EXODN|nr:uncharacterized protein HMPREF1120_05527 [Exophiala dermatitidis NIH/UT8656]EHY57494.1 hypothetical protein HMPREF1120_05527 [Exophiala dermatitidis NIH/UT8656]